MIDDLTLWFTFINNSNYFVLDVRSPKKPSDLKRLLRTFELKSHHFSVFVFSRIRKFFGFKLNFYFYYSHALSRSQGHMKLMFIKLSANLCQI